MLNATVNVPDLNIENGRVVAETDHIAGYTLYSVQHLSNGEMKVIGAHVHEVEVVSHDEPMERSSNEFELGDMVALKQPLDIEGVISSIVYSTSGCCEYEVTYESAMGIARKLMPAPLIEKIGVATEAGAETGSMIRSAQPRV